MPRKSKGARLYLDPTRGEYVIRDGTRFIRTGCPESARAEAEKKLGEYLAEKYKPQPNPAPSIADVLLTYWNEHLSHAESKRANKSTITNLATWWGDKLVSEITPDTCRAYIVHKSPAKVSARRDLQSLKAALNYWHKSKYGPLDRLPVVIMPPAPDGRERWLTRNELARLLWAARGTPHLRRFILLGYYTGSRSAAIRELEWSWVDFNASTMRRRALGKAEQKNKRRPMVRLGKRILAHLRRWKRLDGPHAKYVVHYNGQRIKRQFRHSWQRAVESAGLDSDVVPHTLRHSRATRLMQAGTDMWQAAASLGMSIRTLEKTYGHHHPDFHKKVADVR
jgi:integrase